MLRENLYKNTRKYTDSRRKNIHDPLEQPVEAELTATVQRADGPVSFHPLPAHCGPSRWRKRRQTSHILTLSVSRC